MTDYFNRTDRYGIRRHPNLPPLLGPGRWYFRPRLSRSPHLPKLREAVVRTIICRLPFHDRDRIDNFGYFGRIPDSAINRAHKEILLRALMLYELREVLIPDTSENNSGDNFFYSTRLKPSYLPEPTVWHAFDGIKNAYYYGHYNLMYHIDPIVSNYPKEVSEHVLLWRAVIRRDF